jgi:nitrous oxidase accessory protein
MRFIVLVLFTLSFSLANPLQDAINKSQPYSIIKLQAGTYNGNIIIDKPLQIIGKNDGVIIKGINKGTVIKIRSSNVLLKNLSITDSGDRMENLDSAISIKKALHVEINNCKILNSLYGIDMDMVSDSKITNNYITSKDLDIELRGNAIKMYYSNNNEISNNIIEYSRDVTLNYSHNNLFKNNTFKHNRFATHLSLSNNNKFISNTYKYNSVSLMFMGSKDTNVIKNKIHSSNGAAGMGVMIGMVSNFHFEANSVKFNAKALYIDGKEKAKGMKRYIIANNISYNGEAFHFHASIKDNTIRYNTIKGNIDDVVKDTEGGLSDSNIVELNYWDRYAGFDRDNDGIGDTPHKNYQYADQLWHYNHKVKFFYASPIMSMMNFLANLAPFIEPNLLLVDEKPVFKN